MIIPYEDRDIYVQSQVENICFKLKLSKSALAEILDVSRELVSNWVSGNSEGFVSEHLSVFWYLNVLADLLDEDIRSRLWLWKDRKLSNGQTIKDALFDVKLLPEELAAEINALFRAKTVSLDIKSKELRSKELIDKSFPFANNEVD